MSKPPKLKPCPFCGCAAEFKYRVQPGRYPFYVGCNYCDATNGGTAFRNDDFNAKCWNKRVKVKPAKIVQAKSVHR